MGAAWKDLAGEADATGLLCDGTVLMLFGDEKGWRDAQFSLALRRRRGVPAFELVGWQGESFDDLPTYLEHLRKHLPDAYRASRDFRHFVEQAEKLAAGEVTLREAVSAMPDLRRVGGVCPCSRSVRWVADSPAPDAGAAAEGGGAA